MDRNTELHGDRVALRTVVDADTDTLHRIVREPEVAAWWSTPEDFDGMLVIVLDSEVVGAVQYEEEDDPDYRHASIDLFLSARHHGRGIGAETVRTLARWLIEVRGHHRLTIDPAAANTTAIRSYTRVGFKPVGVLRAYERDPLTGTWRDGLLMDLLAGELT
ncbi:hypothetical protein N566_11480 [Streptomycetaceae bacterium MP113-05]|uniref:aminoglycoside 6'-N-acetyltransferase n=1 Tax=Streptomycetaceae bacterium MP113-05 TaxID=1380770 RepID=UPI0003C58422|nr:aminoglycoside 6'-N-acetyltransferase [Streptomycetaceae bacterium MP113-05]EST37714.1 hypothetical protein N566_11480 [Streptomycetaceae bacterium MP113-05]